MLDLCLLSINDVNHGLLSLEPRREGQQAMCEEKECALKEQ